MSQTEIKETTWLTLAPTCVPRLGAATRSRRFPLARALAAAAALAGCAPPENERGGSEEAEQIVLSLSNVPSEVLCLRLTAEGAARTVSKYVPLDAAAGAAGGTGSAGGAAGGGEEHGGALTKPLGGLPLGQVVFTAEAFERGCDDVTASQIAAWVSDPVTASVTLGRLTTVALKLQRNGRAKVNVSFADEASCSAGGTACGTGRECCSGSCTAGLCAAPADAVPTN